MKDGRGDKPVRPAPKLTDMLKPGDVIYVSTSPTIPTACGACARCRRSAARSSPWTRTRPRARPRRRLLLRPERVQPRHPGLPAAGSSFKPIVYSAALDNGYTPSSIVMDAPISFTDANGKVWAPKNDGGKVAGPSTLRQALEHSRNLVTIRLANEMGMPLVVEYAKRFGIYDDLPPYLRWRSAPARRPCCA